MTRTKLHYLPILTFFLAGNFLIAQDVYDQITDITCECISKKELTGKSQEEINMELGFCIMQSISSDPQKFQKELGFDMTDQASMRKVGEKIGLKMASKCPEALMAIASNQTQIETRIEQQIQGTVKAIDGDDFASITLETPDGSMLKLLLLRKFEAPEAIVSNPQSLKGKQVKVRFASVDLYSLKNKAYLSRKEITALEIVK